MTAGPAFGYGRPPSLDIVTSAWLDTSLSYTSKVQTISVLTSGVQINIYQGRVNHRRLRKGEDSPIKLELKGDVDTFLSHIMF